MAKQTLEAQASDPRLRLLYLSSAGAALIAGLLLLPGMLGVITELLRPDGAGGWRAALQDNWLTVIFKLHAGFSGAETSQLQVLSALDLAILALVGIMYLGLYAALRTTSRIWALVAAIQPFLGIVLFVVTKTAGRSTAMTAALVISLVMLRSSVFERAIAYLGIAASVLLLVGDFSAGMPPTAIIATLFGMGCLLFIAWFFLMAYKLFHLGSAAAKMGAE